MAIAPDNSGEDMLDEFLERQGHDVSTWEENYNKKQCPECSGVHDQDATSCTVCGWQPGV